MKIGLIGYGKMGQIIEALAIKQKHEIVLKINSSNTHLLTKNNLQKCDVCIEFTTPHTALKHIEACFKAGVRWFVDQQDGMTHYHSCKKIMQMQLYFMHLISVWVLISCLP